MHWETKVKYFEIGFKLACQEETFKKSRGWGTKLGQSVVRTIALTCGAGGPRFKPQQVFHQQPLTTLLFVFSKVALFGMAVGQDGQNRLHPLKKQKSPFTSLAVAYQVSKEAIVLSLNGKSTSHVCAA
jgi:hypothetical protein